MKKGGSVHQYESRQLLGGKGISTLWDDAQFSMLNIKHLHLTPKGTNKLLFVWVDINDVYFLDILSHKNEVTKKSNFYTLSFLEILSSDFSRSY